jgi:nucleoside-diphosphate-sugar epimerase
MQNILVIGSAGQIGSELVTELRKRYSHGVVVAGVRKTTPPREVLEAGPVETIDVTNGSQVYEAVKKHQIDTIYNLAALLSVAAEERPLDAWHVGIDGLFNVLEVARQCRCRVFTPSSIGAFGPSTPHDNTPQDTIQRPKTIYGISKLAGELLSDYYFERYGVDTRSVRYPGIISNVTLPGGGTTDYAVEIFHAALKQKKFTCPLKPGTYLDMMYMPDCLQAAIQLMEADPGRLMHRNAFNVSAMSFAPEMVEAEIKKHVPDFEMVYRVDAVKQKIADSWPNKMDDSCAKEEWGWSPRYDLPTMTRDMLTVLGKRKDEGNL